MRKPINKEIIIGRIYDHSLAVKKVQNTESANFGKDYIGGTLDVATDDAGLNIVTINYTYVTEVTKNGNKNNTYIALKNIIENGKTILNDGMEAATCVKCDTSLGLNDFYTNRDGEEVLVSAKRNEMGFISIVNKLPEEKVRNSFEFDMLINGTRYVEADEEKNISEDYLIVKGAIFNFKKDILPVELVCKDREGIKFFENLDVSPKNMVFTKVWGNIHNETIVKKKVEESAFGESAVKEYERSVKEWIITGTQKEEAMYEIGDEKNGITEDEIKTALANREIHLAEVKRKQEEYQASKNAGNTPATNATAPAAQGGFNF